MLLVGEQQNILKLFKIKLVSSMEKCMLHKQTVSDPDLEIRRGGGSLQKKMFSPFGPQFSLNIMGGPRHPGAPPPLDPLLTKHVGEYRKLVLLYYMFTEICLFTKLNFKK